MASPEAAASRWVQREVPYGHTLMVKTPSGAAFWDTGDLQEVVADAPALACRAAFSGLTRAEWHRYVPGLPYQKVC
ncbi:hypothetical protein ACQEVG_17170 [Streptomyces sp. CA-135486]|uniref:hypothetical protein n=1 Tax=Streptomyces sp. CA-135486 TaxID=3240049 RepID=UPI003D89EDA8